MKKLLIMIVTIVFLFGISACKTQKDCRGNKKHKLNNGIWMKNNDQSQDVSI